MDFAPSAGVPENAGECSAHDPSDASHNRARSFVESAKPSTFVAAVVCLRMSDAVPDSQSGPGSHSQADQRIAQAVIFALDGNAQDLRTVK